MVNFREYYIKSIDGRNVLAKNRFGKPFIANAALVKNNQQTPWLALLLFVMSMVIGITL